MKLNILITAGTALAIQGCASMAMVDSGGAMSDDLYFNRNAKLSTATAQPASSYVTETDVASYDNRVAGYRQNNSSLASGYDTRDFSDIQNYYNNGGVKSANVQPGAATATTDSLIAEASASQSDGYWVDGFWGSESDQSYAERMIKFYGPFTTISYYSPLYTQARFSGDWNIYVDGYGSTYLVPRWSNPFYDDFYFGLGFNWRRAHLRWGFGFGWNYGWHWGYDYAWDWWWGSPWYWRHPYYHHHYHPHHHAPHYGKPGGGAPQRYYGSRGNALADGSSTVRRSADGTVSSAARERSAAARYASSASRDQAISRYTRPTTTTSRQTSSQSTGTVRRSATTGSVMSGTTQSTTTRRVSSATTSANKSQTRSSYTPSGSRTVRSSSAVGASRSTSSYNKSATSSRGSSYTPSSSRSSSRSSSAVRRSSGSSSYGGSSIRSGGSSMRSSGMSSGGSRSVGGGGRSSGGGGRTR